MDLSTFFSALAVIVVIDLVLAGDNAIVIALAARRLPTHLQKRAIVWGAVGAIAMRSAMTVVVVWLLGIPGLLLIGGSLLLVIAYRLLIPEPQAGHRQAPAATTFGGAMRTIVVADAVMGLDNVLAVAGAARGSYLLVVVGLLISVPIVVWGSTMLLRLVQRFPAVVYVGAAVLALTAVKMIQAEPLVQPWLASLPWLAAVLYLAIPAVLWAGLIRNHRQLESRIHARLASFALQTTPEGTPAAGSGLEPKGEPTMLNILVPIDDSPNALRAVRHAIGEYRQRGEVQLHLVNVQPRLSRYIARFVGRHERESWQQERAAAATAAAEAVLVDAGIPYRTHVVPGDRAAEICRLAEQLDVHHIVMGTARKNSLTRMLEDSVTHRVLEEASVPVEVIVGDAVSRWERWGVPAGALGAGGLLLLAID